ncbi:MAG: hypothetical protein H7Y27_05175 [Gemmatimonadaceae bacterium]|nr:hypothetical protein [Chitinophagaceae bacterium]
MTDMNQSFGAPEKPKLPSGLNVLTILTIIGSVFAILMACYQFFMAKTNLAKMEEMINSDKYDEMPGFLKKLMTPEALEMTRRGYENRMPIFLISILAAGLCLYGAMQMRKLKMQGYYLYLIGELLPFVIILVFMGTAAFAGFGILSIVFALILIILYTVHRKYLVNN